MNTLLFKAIRLSSKRLEPAIAKQRDAHPIREKLFRYLRILSPLAEIPMRIPEKCRFFLDGKIKGNTKTGVAYKELTETGINRSDIWHQSTLHNTTLTKLFRVGSRLLWFLGLLIHQRKTIHLLDLPGLQVFVGYEAYKRLFRKYPRLIIIIISDISPVLQMQWSGAIAAGNKVMWWQDDYHHFKEFSSENYMPYPCTLAAVLNQKGLENVKSKNKDAKIYSRPPTKTIPIKSVPESPRIGIATNASFAASEEQLDLFRKITKLFKMDNLYIRLHPNSKLSIKSFPANLVAIAPSEESIEEFASKIDLAIVGNSAVQLKLLCEGIPVVHLAGLDNFGFDLYKYCELGFAYGIKTIAEINILDINNFYMESGAETLLFDYVNVRDIDKCLVLRELKKSISQTNQ